MKRYIPLITQILAILGIITCLIALFRQPTDFDLGWHLRFGRDVLSDGIIWRPNTYATGMAGYRWINSSWGLDILRYLLFMRGGFFLFAVLGAVIPTATFLLFIRSFSRKAIDIVLFLPLLAYFLMPLNVHSFRGQQVSLFATAILYWLFSRYENGRHRILWWSVPLFLVWANLQGQFVIGLGIYVLWVAATAVVKPVKDLRHLLTPLVCAGLATLVTPFGVVLYTHDILSHVGNPAVTLINEFSPITPDTPYLFLWLIVAGMIMTAALVAVVLRGTFRKNAAYFFIVFVLYPASFFQSRYLWTLLLAMVPVAIQLFAVAGHGRFRRIAFPGGILLSVYLWYLLFTTWSHALGSPLSWDQYCKYIGCSMKAIPVIKENLQGKRIYVDYNLGGWIIWHVPQVQPLVDGRMSLWRDDHGFSPFLDIYSPIEMGRINPDTAPFDGYLTLNNRPIGTILNYLAQEKKTWRIAFSDNTNTLFVRTSH